MKPPGEDEVTRTVRRTWLLPGYRTAVRVPEGG